jgi:hypothetical protein
VAAAGLPDVLVRDADPLVGLRVRGHLLDQEPVALLCVRVLVQPGADVLEAGGHRVANPLQLVDREDPWTSAGCGDPELDAGARERRAEQLAELPLHG